MSFSFKKLKIQDLILIEPKIYSDDRGYFLEIYKETDFVDNGISETFIQDNHSFSLKNVIRGLHYQLPPKDQGKLVTVIKGAIFDVAVDIRQHSNTYKQWVSVILSDENASVFYIPSGFAHGFLALTNKVHVVYKCTEEYSVEHEFGVIWNDPDINVLWPIKNPIISKKDSELPLLKNSKVFL